MKRSLDAVLADARQLSADERQQLIDALLADAPSAFAASPPYLWELVREAERERPEYQVGVAQALSLAEIQKRIGSQNRLVEWLG